MAGIIAVAFMMGNLSTRIKHLESDRVTQADIVSIAATLTAIEKAQGRIDGRLDVFATLLGTSYMPEGARQ